MDLNVLAYVIYLTMALPLTFYVARTLHRFGKVFLLDVFNGDDALAHAVNQLLLTGFYLLNVGYVTLFMTAKGNITDARRLFEVLSTKIGAVALVVGAVHFTNVWAFNAFRRRAVLRARAIAPVTPNGFTAVTPPGWAGWPPPGVAVPPPG
jgi:hypothetical protein